MNSSSFQEVEEEIRETFNHRARNKEKQGLLVSQLSHADFNVTQKAFSDIIAKLRKKKNEIGQDPQVIRYSDYLWILSECRQRSIQEETLQEIYKKLKGSRKMTVSMLLSLVQGRRPQTTESDILKLLRKFGINYTQHEGILAKQFVELLSRAQRKPNS